MVVYVIHHLAARLGFEHQRCKEVSSALNDAAALRQNEDHVGVSVCGEKGAEVGAAQLRRGRCCTAENTETANESGSSGNDAEHKVLQLFAYTGHF